MGLQWFPLEGVFSGECLVRVRHSNDAVVSSASMIDDPVELRRYTVELLSARNLIAMDACGTSDPFAILTCGEEQRQSTVKEKTLSPTWNERFDFIIPFGPADLRIVLADSDD